MGTTSRGWRKSTFSDQGDCVEIKFSSDRILVRNSRRPEARHLAFAPEKWREFLVGLSSGEMVPVPTENR